ncbi:MAG: hypothetical protein GWP10_20310 [Nitrospiraceae bacterium]|nr:hypothetical protein [Nitrospiraceae bacterium]
MQETETDFRWKLEEKIALSKIGDRTIQKQFLANYHAKNPYSIAKEAIKAYKEFCADISRTYSTYGSVRLSRYLCEVYNIVVSEKTLIAWLRSLDVKIHPPTQQRERVARSRWERERMREIKRLREELDWLKKTYNTTIDELSMCRSALRLCVSEKESLEHKLTRKEVEIKEIMINKQKGDINE